MSDTEFQACNMDERTNEEILRDCIKSRDKDNFIQQKDIENLNVQIEELEAQNKALTTEVERLKAKYEPKFNRIKFCYMTDHHTFIQLNGETIDEILLEADEAETKYSYGMLCPVRIFDSNGKDGSVGISAHSRGEDKEYWNAQKKKWRESIESNDIVMKLIALNQKETKA